MNFKYHERILENGLRVVAEVSQDVQTSAIGFFINTGSRDESPKIMGISHFLEHMMFKGTNNMNSEDVDKAFDNLGANHNAYTSNEITAFWAHCPYKVFHACTEILTQILRPALRDQDVKDECKVILEEIAMYKDQPFWVLYEQSLEMLYPNHSLSNRVLGTEETVSLLSSDDLRKYHEKKYGTKNTIVTASGRLCFDKLCLQLEQNCKHWPAGEKNDNRKSIKPKNNNIEITSRQVNRSYLIEMIPAPSIKDYERYLAGMIAAILGGINSSKLYWSLIEPGIAEEAQCQYEGHDGLGEIISFVVCDPKNKSKVKSILAKQRNNFIQDLKNEEIESVQRILSTTAAMQSEQTAGRMQRLGQMLTTINEYKPLEDELSEIKKITLSNLKDYLLKFPLNPSVISCLTPSE